MKESYNALFEPLPDKISQNDRAGEIMGMREETLKGAMPIDLPCELGYHCPICKHESIIDGTFDERLHWSEYNSFLWCAVCNLDIPSCLCIPDLTSVETIKTATEIFLDSVESARKLRENRL